METDEPNETIATLECVTDVMIESKSDIQNILGNSGLKDTNEIIEKIEQIKKEQVKKNFIESMERKYRLNMLHKRVGMVGA